GTVGLVDQDRHGSGRIERQERVVALERVALDELHGLAVLGEHETHVTGTCGQGVMMKNRHQAGGQEAPVSQRTNTIRGIEPTRGRNKAIRSSPIGEIPWTSSRS